MTSLQNASRIFSAFHIQVHETDMFMETRGERERGGKGGSQYTSLVSLVCDSEPRGNKFPSCRVDEDKQLKHKLNCKSLWSTYHNTCTHFCWRKINKWRILLHFKLHTLSWTRNSLLLFITFLFCQRRGATLNVCVAQPNLHCFTFTHKGGVKCVSRKLRIKNESLYDLPHSQCA